ncbi:hypothetical protein ASC95_03750 [Pelomonas sp. Root1217]|uniref:hypothetical protein n=1 Tax=Pelomonas sp. Root1217 TaxID=1736430 RepID=UPI00070D08A7|nr:hypothetical protein [Pelomonas sp. Root1217]KQV60570.1 hypothetical protein ASC95_03750 [Pelomonas sp. Root1217]
MINQSLPAEATMILKPILAVLATSALTMKLVQHLGQKHQQRRVRHDGKQHREDVSRWEAEGGNLPEPQLPAKR